MGEIKKIAFCSLFAALSVTVMFFCVVVPFLEFSILGVCGAFLVVVYLEVGEKRAFLTYFVISVLAVFVVFYRFLVLCYVLFFGYYPILKFRLENSNRLFLRFFLKPLIFIIIAIISVVFFEWFFTYGQIKRARIYSFILVVFSLYIYDLFLGAFSKYYLINLRHRIFKSN